MRGCGRGRRVRGGGRERAVRPEAYVSSRRVPGGGLSVEREGGGGGRIRGGGGGGGGGRREREVGGRGGERPLVSWEGRVPSFSVAGAVGEAALGGPVVFEPVLVLPVLVLPALVLPSLVDPSLLLPFLVLPTLVEPALLLPSLVLPSLLPPSLLLPPALRPPPPVPPSRRKRRVRNATVGDGVADDRPGALRGEGEDVLEESGRLRSGAASRAARSEQRSDSERRQRVRHRRFPTIKELDQGNTPATSPPVPPSSTHLINNTVTTSFQVPFTDTEKEPPRSLDVLDCHQFVNGAEELVLGQLGEVGEEAGVEGGGGTDF